MRQIFLNHLNKVHKNIQDLFLKILGQIISSQGLVHSDMTPGELASEPLEFWGTNPGQHLQVYLIAVSIRYLLNLCM